MTKGERIRDLRRRRGLSQVALADRAGISKQSLYKYETDVITNIPSDKIEALAENLNVSPAVLMGWEEEIVLTDTEADLLRKYRRLDEREQGRVDQMVDDLLGKKEAAMEDSKNVG
ncbi:MAG: helix-turn-helix domain-containing protein [Bacteroidales bacterium]|nr:helix-turn-helix domain-containing protein [Bacteroidales bacterium]